MNNVLELCHESCDPPTQNFTIQYLKCISGTWYTEYAYIDVEDSSVTQAMCGQLNNSDGLQRVWHPMRAGQTENRCLVLPPPPVCRPAPRSRVNHLGNGVDGVPLNYTWTLPYFPSGVAKRVVVRIR